MYTSQEVQLTIIMLIIALEYVVFYTCQNLCVQIIRVLR